MLEDLARLTGLLVNRITCEVQRGAAKIFSVACEVHTAQSHRAVLLGLLF